MTFTCMTQNMKLMKTSRCLANPSFFQADKWVDAYGGCTVPGPYRPSEQLQSVSLTY